MNHCYWLLSLLLMACKTTGIGSAIKIGDTLPSLILSNGNGENDEYTGIARVQASLNCTGWLWKPALITSSKALIITNGHCVQSFAKQSSSYEILLDSPSLKGWSVTFNYFIDTQDSQETYPISKVVYSTMKGIDLAILELDVSYESLEGKGIKPLQIANAEPNLFEEIFIVGAPTGGIPSDEQFLRKSRCKNEGLTNIAEWHWTWTSTSRNSCLDIAKGSSGSPVFNLNGEINGIINTTSQGGNASNCYTGNPCEISGEGSILVPGKNYVIPLINLDYCWNGNKLEFNKPCPLSSPLTISFETKLRNPTRPMDDKGEAIKWSFDFKGQDSSKILWQMGSASSLKCLEPSSYKPFSNGVLDIQNTIIPDKDGLYQVCFIHKDQLNRPFLRPTFANLYIDTIPPVFKPKIAIVNREKFISIEPIFDIPDHADFEIGFGPEASTDCNTIAFARYRRIPMKAPVESLPLKICIYSWDTAGNKSHVFEEHYSG